MPPLRAQVLTAGQMVNGSWTEITDAVHRCRPLPRVAAFSRRATAYPGTQPRLRPGSLIMTWTDPLVDFIVDGLHRMRIVSDEMESDQHQDRIPLARLQDMLRHVGFGHSVHRRFECGLNNLLVAVKPEDQSPRRDDHTADRQRRS